MLLNIFNKTLSSIHVAVVLKIAEKEHGQDVCITEVYKELCQTSKIEVFINTKLLGKIFNDTHRENVIQFNNLLEQNLGWFWPFRRVYNSIKGSERNQVVRKSRVHWKMMAASLKKFYSRTWDGFCLNKWKCFLVEFLV